MTPTEAIAGSHTGLLYAPDKAQEDEDQGRALSVVAVSAFLFCPHLTADSRMQAWSFEDCQKAYLKEKKGEKVAGTFHSNLLHSRLHIITSW
jgi:gas vesicle protein